MIRTVDEIPQPGELICESVTRGHSRLLTNVVAPGLAIGVTDHIPALISNGWHCVVLAENFQPTAAQARYVKCVPLIDDGGNPRVRIIEALEAVATTDLRYSRVAIVCRLGESRSVAIACGFLAVSKAARTMSEALEAIRENRPEANPSWRLFQDVRKVVKETQQFQD